MTRFSAFSIIFFFSFSLTNTAHSGRHVVSAIVIDAKNGNVLHSENADLPRHPASLAKKMTLFLIFEALQNKKISLNTTYNVSPQAARAIPCKLGISAGKAVTVDTIIKGLVTKSANDMAVVVAEGLSGSMSKFVEMMNAKARELGMKNTTFTNPSGVPDRGQSFLKRGVQRQTTTARDMAILSQALYNKFPEHWKYFKIRTFNFLGSAHHNHNHLMKSFPGMDGIKTGWVNASGFNLSTSAIRYTQAGNPVRLFAVVLGGTTRHVRDRRMASLLETHFKKLGATVVKNNNTTDELFTQTNAPAVNNNANTNKLDVLFKQTSTSKIKRKKSKLDVLFNQPA
ncbi:MAG: D-alanyl-D-alanine carboxypeptidase family protein [Pseudomonadota bacterium]